MPPLLMTTLFSIVLNLFAPHANITLPHVAAVTQGCTITATGHACAPGKIDNVAGDISFE